MLIDAACNIKTVIRNQKLKIFAKKYRLHGVRLSWAVFTLQIEHNFANLAYENVHYLINKVKI